MSTVVSSAVSTSTTATPARSSTLARTRASLVTASRATRTARSPRRSAPALTASTALLPGSPRTAKRVRVMMSGRWDEMMILFLSRYLIPGSTGWSFSSLTTRICELTVAIFHVNLKKYFFKDLDLNRYGRACFACGQMISDFTRSCSICNLKVHGNSPDSTHTRYPCLEVVAHTVCTQVQTLRCFTALAFNAVMC